MPSNTKRKASDNGNQRVSEEEGHTRQKVSKLSVTENQAGFFEPTKNLEEKPYHEQLNQCINWFKQGNISLICQHFEKLRQQDKMVDFMKETEYKPFKLALEKENIDIIKALFENMPLDFHINMVEHLGFRPFKGFVQRTMQLPYKDYNDAVAQRKASILEYCIAPSPPNISKIAKRAIKELKRKGTSYNPDSSYKLINQIDEITNEQIKKCVSGESPYPKLSK